MLGSAGTSYALFAVVWSVMCMLSGALVTDSMLRNTPAPSITDAEQGVDAAAEV